ncbi:MAG: apolipoprotein N-acyltransferase [Gammaproteobacteria bacterium]|jgi:apolipoprotein N-acyltransferase|nr:apolipoprotein N-acyltransferase [Gammaproteobacteria bacterium]MBT6478288.1 apolipoprotein N-acyltransferase [Gammaproteobacteria bacterium]
MLLSGALLPFAFAPFEQVWVAPVAIALLFYTWMQCQSLRDALRVGGFFGVGFFGVGVSWVYVSVQQFGGVGELLSLLIVTLFIALLSLFFMVQGGLFYLLREQFCSVRRCRVDFLLPLIWVLFEWVRSHLLGGFPWLLLGHTAPGSFYRGLAPWLGTYGVSFYLALLALLVVLLLRRPDPSSGSKKGVVATVVTLLVIGWVSGTMHWSKPSGEPLSVALVQGNFSQEEKWQPDNLSINLNRYKQATDSLRQAQLVVWPETAVPAFRQQVEHSFLEPLSRQLAMEGRSLLTGIPLLTKEDYQYLNGIILLGKEQGEYHKRQLVPFGEYMPFRSWFMPLLEFIDIPFSSFSEGARSQPLLTVAGQPIAATICYEVAYPELTFSHYADATLLVTISNDGWFGNTLAPHQHLQIARMRALESARPMLRATNTGITAIIDAEGEVIQQLPQDEFGVLEAIIQPQNGVTPYLSWFTKGLF